ncbi:MAG: cytochrome P460 family protein [Psychroserpens sp.]|uniref:cytochrome P460 family protein n=1 Tax=Psychroserpens sp. TaxID=2020870 RepID=UPI0030026A88
MLKKIFKPSSYILIVTVIAFMSCKNEDTYKEISYYTINEQGELERPTDFRTWVFVGTPLTPNELNNGNAAFPEFHSVYIDPVSFKHYKKTGKFREGTIMIKELITVGDKMATSGSGYFMGEYHALEATIKSKKDFPDAAGNWAYFPFHVDDSGTLPGSVKAQPDVNCNACHDANAADDFVFTQYYPILSAAKGVGDVSPEDSDHRGSEMKVNMGGTTATSEENSTSDYANAGIWEASAPTPEDLDLDFPLGKEELFAYLNTKKYQEFKTQESEAHPSIGPHTKLGWPVRTYMNDILAESMTSGNSSHPIGSAVVKEMFTDQNVLNGWAVYTKTQDDTAAGKGWFWYEVTSTEDSNAIQGIGNGVNGCVGCHAIGKDMVRSAFPFK